MYKMRIRSKTAIVFSLIDFWYTLQPYAWYQKLMIPKEGTPLVDSRLGGASKHIDKIYCFIISESADKCFFLLYKFDTDRFLL